MASFETKWLKKRFVDKSPKELTAIADRKDPWFAMANKPSYGGASVAEPVVLSGAKGWSSTLVGAQLTSVQVNNGASDDDEFNSPYGKYFGSALFSLKSVVLGRAAGPDAYMRVLENTTMGAVGRFGESVGRMYAGPIGLSIGKITNVAGGGGAGKMTITVRGDAYNFVPGMVLDAASGDGSAGGNTVRSAGNGGLFGYVIAVSPDGDTNGTQLSIATSEALQQAGTNGTPGGWANADFLFRAGDVTVAANPEGVRSLQNWVRLTNPAPGTLQSALDISRDQRLSGIKVAAADVAGMGFFDRVQILATEMAAASGATPDYVSAGPRTYAQAMGEAQAFGRFVLGNDPKLGIRNDYFTVATAAGILKVICNPHQLEADIWILSSEHMMIYSPTGSELPVLRQEDGNVFLRTGENYEVQFYAFSSATVDGRPDKFGRVASGN